MLYGKKYGGADPQLIEGDSFRMIISVPEFGKDPAKEIKIIHTEAQVEAQEAQVEAQEAQVNYADWQLDILTACSSGDKAGKDLLRVAGYTSRTGNFKKGLQHLLDESLLEMTIPDKPKSRLQKYRITEIGRRLLHKTQK